MSATRAPAVLFAGGGTGGHLFPGLAIAEAYLEACRIWGGFGEVGEDSTPRTLFLCSNRAIDARILGAARLGRTGSDGGGPVEYQATKAAPFVVRPRGLVRFFGGWGPTVRQGREAIRSLRESGGVTRDGSSGGVRVVALGGFVAAPLVQAARVERVPITMLNLDAVPGLANRWIAKRATEIFTSAEVEDPIARSWVVIPPIVRREAMAPTGDGAMQRCRVALGLDPEMRTLVVTGASQGARSINRLMEAFVAERGGALAGWQVFHQTGRDEVEGTRAMYERAGIPARVESFIEAMGLVWGAADLAISRAGAGSVGEVWANRVPTLFMPYPYHKDQHQRINAKPLERCGGAEVLEDLIEPGPNMGRVGVRLEALLGDEGARVRMRANLVGLGPADGAERVAKALVVGSGTGGMCAA
jgi:UDP-N-acetylglucosamine--N-acetylmuramyl-(pentapeptide) pyrophosphoryl-undecaprenol N-acetylglucosamine transferase